MATGKYRYKCPYCPALFSTAERLELHRKLYHPKEA
jgi:hypothetical protein